MQWPLVLIFYLVVQGGDFCCVLFPSVYCPATTAKKRCAYKAINFIKEMMRYFFWHFFKSRTIVLPITSPYICVVARFLCPNSFCTVVILAPLYINKVALVWRAEWNEKCLFILANLLFVSVLYLRLNYSLLKKTNSISLGISATGLVPYLQTTGLKAILLPHRF